MNGTQEKWAAELHGTLVLRKSVSQPKWKILPVKHMIHDLTQPHKRRADSRVCGTGRHEQ